ncbi:MAG: LPXTG cell wall anchor domain-containing protein, partial [Clostridia bacterium]|nr:LPXTG cell wall anchor domain-containing protein [Clostridia bacterium]
TVTIVVDGYDDKPVKCYRLKGDGVDALKVNDVITVEGTLKKYKGTPEFDEGCELKSVVPAPTESAEPQPTPSTPEEILNALYALGKNEAMEGEYTLTGKITKINTAYSTDYKNITVTIVVDGFEDKPVQCFRLAGEGADTLKVDDVITVKGKLKNYNGTPEFDADCQLLAVVPASDPEPTGTSEPQPTPSTAEEILNALYALEKGEALEGTYTLSGVITQVNTPYNAQYKDVTVTIVVGDFTDKPVMCYCLKGEGVDTLKVGDSITVSGALKRYNDTREFDKDCQLVSIDARGEAQTDEEPVPTTPEEIVNAVYDLDPGAFLNGNFTLTGVITSIDTPFNPDYNNVTVTIVVGNMTDKPIMCYRLAGNGADDLAVGDTITVSGLLKKYHKDGQPDIPEFDAGCSLDKVVKAQQPQPQTGDFSLAIFAAIILVAMSAALVLAKKRSF